jgi:predicted nucleic acid-binding protein
MNLIDTNIFVYATDETDSAKHVTVRRLLERTLKGGWPIAAQVYGEYFSVVTRKRLVSRTSARQVIGAWSALMPPMPSSVTAHTAALNLATDKQVQYWDALIIAICAEHGVTQLYTEDAPSAPKLLGVKCVSPW